MPNLSKYEPSEERRAFSKEELLPDITGLYSLEQDLEILGLSLSDLPINITRQDIADVAFDERRWGSIAASLRNAKD